jgi:hypothetical protein
MIKEIIDFFKRGCKSKSQYEAEEKREFVQRLIDLNGHVVVQGMLNMQKNPNNNTIAVQDVDGQWYSLKGYPLVKRYNSLTKKHEFVVDKRRELNELKKQCCHCHRDLIEDQFGFMCPNENCSSLDGHFKKGKL